MNNKLILTLTIVLFSIACDDTENARVYESYFPTDIGISWYYTRIGSDTNPSIKREINNKINIGDRYYYRFIETSLENDENIIINVDTLRKENENKIYKYSKGKEYLLFDFTLNHGDTYLDSTFTINGEYSCVVTYSEIGEVEISSQIYRECYEFFFDIPEVVDEEAWYIFAPGIGLIKRYYGEGPSYILNSYEFKHI